MVDLREMREADLEEVTELSDLAFIAVIELLYGRRLERPFFPPAGLALRLETDPGGCLVAVEAGRLVGALFSVALGTLAWFGPLAVAREGQGRGVGQALVAECLRRWSDRRVRILGLETFPSSSFHLHLYSKFGFRPSWTGVQLRKSLAGDPEAMAAVEPAPPLQHPQLPLPDLGYLHPGFDPSAEVRATLGRRAGRIFATDRGLAILHLRDAFHVTEQEAFVPLLVAPDRETFESLLQAAEDAARADGKLSLGIRLSGSCWGAFQALVGRGFQAGGSALRMKAGIDLDYDRDKWYCDDWL